jgi:hypothetical protein
MPAPTQEARQKGNRNSATVRTAMADEFCESVAPMVRVMRNVKMSLRAIAEELNRQEIAPRRRPTGNWRPEQVKRILTYIEKKKAAKSPSPATNVARSTPGGADILLIVAGKIVGPYKMAEVVKMLRKGTIPPETMHKRPSMKTCRPLHKLAKTFLKRRPNPR